MNFQTLMEIPQVRGSIWPLMLIAWASPWSLVGALFGVLGLLTGGRAQRSGRVLEFYGGAPAWILSKMPLYGGASAITLGHVVLARSQQLLDFTRKHEGVHVAQYELLGPFFIPAYLGWSLWLWCVGLDPYWDNPFEKEAHRVDSPKLPPAH